MAEFERFANYGETNKNTLSLQRKMLASSHNIRSISPDRQECACVCLAKDEAPYLHEYIHHHLYFGFSKILVLVNRTSDNSTEILNKIAESKPQVLYVNIDWIDDIFDEPGAMQGIGLSHGIVILRTHQEIRYALLNDVDEFWFPVDFSTNIREYLSSLPAFQQASFCWAGQLTPESPFQRPFCNKKMVLRETVKSIVDIRSNIFATGAHRSIIGGNNVCVDPSGAVSKKGVRNRYRERLDGHRAYVLHRMQRSEDEYLSLLLRGDLREHYTVKANRQGYLDVSSSDFQIPVRADEAYQESLDRFISDCNIGSEIEEARRNVLSKVTDFPTIVERMIASATNSVGIKSDLRRVLTGTRYRHLADGMSQLDFSTAGEIHMKPSELVELVKSENAAAFGNLPDKRAEALIGLVLAQLGKQIEALDQGAFRVQGLGTFKVGVGAQDQPGAKGTSRRIVFRAEGNRAKV